MTSRIPLSEAYIDARARRVLQSAPDVSPSGIVYGVAGRTRADKVQEAMTVQRELIEAAMEFLGDTAYDYAVGLGAKKKKKLKQAWQFAKDLSGHDVPYSTFTKWFHHFLLHGETRRETASRNRGKKRYPESKSFDEEDRAALVQLLEEEPHLYLDEIQSKMEKLRKKSWSVSTLWQQISKREGFTLQALVHRATQIDMVERAQFRQRYTNFVSLPEDVIWVGETNRASNASRCRHHGWSERYCPPVDDTFFHENFRKQYTMIGAADINGFVFPACMLVERERRLSDRDPNIGTVDIATFEEYVEYFLVPELGQFRKGEARSVVMMDETLIDLSSRVSELIEGAGAVLLSTAPYSPVLNPIEFVFGAYMEGLKRISRLEGLRLVDAHVGAVLDVTPEMTKEFYLKSKVPGIEELLEKEAAARRHRTLKLLLIAGIILTYRRITAGKVGIIR